MVGIFSNAVKVVIKGKEVRRLSSEGKTIYRKSPFIKLDSITSRLGTSWIDTGFVGAVEFYANMSIIARDERGLMGFGAGRGQYFGATHTNQYNTEPNLKIANSNPHLLQDISFILTDNGTVTMTLSTPYGDLVTADAVYSSNTFCIGKGIGASWEGDFTFTSARIIKDGVEKNFIPVKLIENINSDYNNSDVGSIGDVGMWEINEDRFYSNKGSTPFSYVEPAIDGEYTLINGIKSTNGAFINTWYYPKLNDNFNIEFDIFDSTTWHTHGFQKRPNLNSTRFTIAQADNRIAIISLAKNNGTTYVTSTEGTSFPVGTRIKLTATDTELTINDAYNVVTDNRGTQISILPFYIGAYNNEMSGYSRSSANLYIFDFEKRSGTPLHSFRPAKINSSNELVWVDLVNKKYYRNYNTTGTFSEVASPSS